ncbi:hypothetical protein [Pseudomonas fluorescens]|uniref:hypothetical protein n=1 Tax=Pseudomonas TaxID=286 RepID=UPI003CFD8671
MSTKPTKIEREFMEPLDRLIEEFAEAQSQSDPLNFQQLKRLMELSLENKISEENVKDCLDNAFATFEKLMMILPEITPRLTEGVSGLVFAVLNNKIATACEIAETERSRATPKKKSMAKERAWVIAKDLWIADIDKKIRVSEMADKVYKALLEEGFHDALPGKSEQLVKWLKEKEVPEHASLPGR